MRSFQRAVSRVGGRVVAVDIHPQAAGLYAADAWKLVPRSDDSSFVPAVEELCRTHHIGLLVPTRDEELPVFAACRDRFAALGVRVMAASPTVIARCQDKQAFLDFCQAEGFPCASPVLEPDRPRPELYPLFCRRRRGKGGAGARRVASWPELRAALEREPDLVVQECVEAPEFTVDLCADFDGQVLTVVPRRRLHVFGGESFITRTEANHAIQSEAVRLAERLGLVGHNTIQCFLAEGRPLFIEVNPRFGGAASLGIAAGADTPDLLVRLALGEAIEPRLGMFADGLTMLRYTDDLFLGPDGAVRPPAQ